MGAERARVIVISGLRQLDGDRLILAIDSLRVGAGEAVGIVLPLADPGVVLWALLLGRVRPGMGSLRLAGLDPYADRATLSRRLGVVLDVDALYPRQTARANLVFHCRLHGLPRERAESALTRAALADDAGSPAERLSPGPARRLALARALLHAPDVLLLQDPFARADETSAAIVEGMLVAELTRGTAILATSDRDTWLRRICDYTYTLVGGRLEAVREAPAEAQERLPFKIPVRIDEKIVLVSPGEILYALAQEGRTGLQTTGGLLPTQYTLAELEERLRSSGFFRAHRGYLVNLQHVREVIPYTRNSYTLRLDDPAGTEIPLSKSAAAELRSLLGY